MKCGMTAVCGRCGEVYWSGPRHKCSRRRSCEHLPRSRYARVAAMQGQLKALQAKVTDWETASAIIGSDTQSAGRRSLSLLPSSAPAYASLQTQINVLRNEVSSLDRGLIEAGVTGSRALAHAEAVGADLLFTCEAANLPVPAELRRPPLRLIDGGQS